jgi:hypothetical protein
MMKRIATQSLLMKQVAVNALKRLGQNPNLSSAELMRVFSQAVSESRSSVVLETDTDSLTERVQ